ncbi:hypothetical protein Tco_1085303 [Tanacetum coccineum]
MAEDDEEKTGFHTEEGVYCFTHMPKGLKNFVATLQRMVEKVLADQKGWKVEVYLEEIVVKSKDEQSLIEETLNKLKWVNMKIDPNKSTFGIKEGRFLGYTITKDGIRPDPVKTQAVMKSHTPRGPNQIRHLSLELASIGRVRQSALCYSWKEGEFKCPSLLSVGRCKTWKHAILRQKNNLSFNLHSTVSKENFPEALNQEGTTATYVERKRGRGTQIKQQTPSRTNPNGKGMEFILEQKSKQRRFRRGVLVDQVEGSKTPSTEEARKYKEETMEITTQFHRFRITYPPKKLNSKVEVPTGLVTIKLKFLNQEVLVGIKTRPSVEVGNNDKEGKSTSKVPMRKPNYN